MLVQAMGELQEPIGSHISDTSPRDHDAEQEVFLVSHAALQANLQALTQAFPGDNQEFPGDNSYHPLTTVINTKDLIIRSLQARLEGEGPAEEACFQKALEALSADVQRLLRDLQTSKAEVARLVGVIKRYGGDWVHTDNVDKDVSAEATIGARFGACLDSAPGASSSHVPADFWDANVYCDWPANTSPAEDWPTDTGGEWAGPPNDAELDIQTPWIPRDEWTHQHVGALLHQLGQWTLKDESRSGKLAPKGRGLWEFQKCSTADENLWNYQQEMCCSFLRDGKLYDYSKLVKYATHCGGHHELVQKMLASANTQQKTYLARKFGGQITLLINNQFACLVLQQLMLEADVEAKHCMHTPDVSRHEFVKTVVKLLKDEFVAPGRIVEISECPHGNHVVQKWVQLVHLVPSEEESLLCVLAQVIAHLVAIATTQTGCRIVNRLLEIPACHELSQQILDRRIFPHLVTNAYGNFVVSHMLRENHRRPSDKLAVLELLHENFERQFAGHWTYAGYGDHDCFYGDNFYGRHVVQNCLHLKGADCHGWAELLASLAQVALEPNGTPKHNFMCLLGTQNQHQVLDGLRSRLSGDQAPQPWLQHLTAPRLRGRRGR